MIITKCQYQVNYTVVKNHVFETHPCENDVLTSGLCKFHDPTYLNDATRKDIEDSFMNILDSAIKHDKKILCVGYHLSDIDITGIFTKEVHFDHSTFHGKVNFDNSTFEKDVQFSNCVFEKESSFSGVTFNDEVNFFNSQFYGDRVTVESAFFNKKASFIKTTFPEALFTFTKFHEVNFSNSEFNGNTDFWHVDFYDKVEFGNSRFNEPTNFSYSTFDKSTNFENASFLDYTKFRKAHFLDKDSVYFDGDLSNVSFLETDITRVKFGNKVTWNISESKHKRFQKTRQSNKEFMILDERILENNREPELQLESVKDTYRNLRDNYEFQSRYDVSGEFFVREMELKRKYSTNPKGSEFKTSQKNVFTRVISILYLYNLIAQYGQSYFRPIYITIPCLLFSTVYFWTSGFHQNIIIDPARNDLKDATIRSLSAFFPFYTFDKYQRLSDLILRIVLLPISGAFFLAMKRKLERQLRH